MKNLITTRKQEGLTQKKIAEIINVSQQSYSDYENEKTNPDLTTLVKIADVLKVSIDYLIGREDDMGNIVILSNNAFELSPMEQRLLLDFRKLPPETQNNFVQLFHNLATSA